MVAQAIKSLTDAENEVLLQLHSHQLFSLYVLLNMPTCHCNLDYTSCHIIHVAVLQAHSLSNHVPADGYH